MNVPPSFQSNHQQALHHHHHYNHRDDRYNQYHPGDAVVPVNSDNNGVRSHRQGIPSAVGGSENGRLGEDQQAVHHSSSNHKGNPSTASGRSDKKAPREPKKKDGFWATTKKKLFPGLRIKRESIVQSEAPHDDHHNDKDLTNMSPTNGPPEFIHIDAAQSNGNKVSSMRDGLVDQKATIEQLQSNLERERKVVHEYHEDWEDSQLEALKLKQYVSMLQNRTRKLKSQIVRINQEHILKNFRQVPRPIPELPFLCPLNPQLPEEYPIVGKYVRGKLLGGGQYGMVWEAMRYRKSSSSGNSHDSNSGGSRSVVNSHYGDTFRKLTSKKARVFAIKEIEKNRLNTYGKLVALNQEVQALQLYQHPNIIQLHGVFHGPKSFYMVFEKAWMDAHTLHHRVANLPTSTIRHIMKAVLSALQHLHANGVSHLDIKLENILILHPGGPGVTPGADDRRAAHLLRPEHVRLGDFGFCTIEGNNRHGQVQRQDQPYHSSSSSSSNSNNNNNNSPYHHGDMPGIDVGGSFMSRGVYPVPHHDLDGNQMNDSSSAGPYEHAYQAKGTPGYYAPEMVEREHYDAKAADMWSAGTCLMELSVGLGDFWWNTYDGYSRHLYERLHRQIRCHPQAPAAQSTASSSSSSSSTIKPLGPHLYWYLQRVGGLKWSDEYLKDLILNKLMVAPEQRITASAALKHVWMCSIDHYF